MQDTERDDVDPNPDPFVRGMDPRIRIGTKMSRIPNTTLRDRAGGISNSVIYSFINEMSKFLVGS
jgi:hypothetical protein